MDRQMSRAGKDAKRAAQRAQRFMDENEQVLVCDFCAHPLPDRFATYVTKRPLQGVFSHVDTRDLSSASIKMNYDERWAACAACDPVVAAGDPVALAKHALAQRTGGRANLLSPETVRLIEGDLVGLYRAFYEAQPARMADKREEERTTEKGEKYEVVCFEYDDEAESARVFEAAEQHFKDASVFRTTTPEKDRWFVLGLLSEPDRSFDWGGRPYKPSQDQVEWLFERRLGAGVRAVFEGDGDEYHERKHYEEDAPTVGVDSPLGMGSTERSDFFRLAMDPRFPDEFALLARREHPETEGTLSKEVIETLSYQVHDFVMASLMRRWRQTGVPPKSVRLNLGLDWEDERDMAALGRDEPSPWFQVDDTWTGSILPSTDGEIREMVRKQFLSDD